MIETGIYEDIFQQLYFVLGTAVSCGNSAEQVIYHPLFVKGNRERVGWLCGISPESFLENIEVQFEGRTVSLSHTHRFTKVLDWTVPNILPGSVWLNPREPIKSGHETWNRILALEKGEDGRVVVKAKNQERLVRIDLADLKNFYIYSHMFSSLRR